MSKRLYKKIANSSSYSQHRFSIKYVKSKINKNEFVLYGLNNHKEIINKIISDLNVVDYSFDIKLILTEALTNAFKHGNKSNEKKPIYLRYFYNGTSIKFEVEDSGTGFQNVVIPKESCDENLLDNEGRGLFLIKCYSDKVELRKNTLIIQKCLVV